LSAPEPNNPTATLSRGLASTLAGLDFRRLWYGQIFSQLADKFYILLMVFLITHYLVISPLPGDGALAEAAASINMQVQTKKDLILLLYTGVLLANTAPAMVLGTVAGVWADRWPKRQVMVISNGLRALLALLIPLCLIEGPTWLGLSWGYWGLLVITFLESCLTQFFAPAEQAAIPLLVPGEKLLAANSIYQATSMGATIVGFAIGEPILSLLHHLLARFGNPGGEFLLLPFCYGMAAVILARIDLKETLSSVGEQSLWREIGEGLAVLRERTTVRNAMLQLVLLYSLLAALSVLALSLATEIKALGPNQFGILLAMTGLGLAVGAIGVAQIGHGLNRRLLASTGLATIAFSLVLLGEMSGQLVVTLALCTLLGVGAALLGIPAQTTIQEDTPESVRGKVFGLQNNLINIALSLPLALAGGLVSSYGLLTVLWLLAGLALAAAFLERPWQR
jgi:MFS family permease